MSETASGEEGRPEAAEVLCPHCGLRQPAAAECSTCGVVFAKLAASVAPAPEGPVPAPPSRRPPPVFRVTPSVRRRGVWPGYWVLLGLALLSAIVFWPRRNTPRLALHGDADAIAAETSASTEDAFAAAPPGARAPKVRKSSPPAAPVPSAPEVRELPAVRAPYSWYEGARGYRKGVEEARLDRRPLGIYLFTDDCADCRRFSDGLLRSSEVTDYLRGVVKVRLDPGAGPDEKAIADQLGVTVFPALVLVPPGGSPRRIPTGAPGSPPRLATPAELILEMQNAIGPASG